MEIIRKRAYARAGLLGNPSDGYNGKTISFSVGNFWAEVVLYEWETVEIVLSENDRNRFRSVQDLALDVGVVFLPAKLVLFKSEAFSQNQIQIIGHADKNRLEILID